MISEGNLLKGKKGSEGQLKRYRGLLYVKLEDAKNVMGHRALYSNILN